MRGCRAERPTRFGLGAVLLLLAQPLPAAAQTGAPTPLFPPPPAADTPATATPPGAAALAPAPTGIDAALLSEIVNDGIGPLEDEAGLGPELWRGTSRSLVEALIPQIPKPESVAARRLTRRLLLTSALPPEGIGEADLIRLRAERLMAFGYAADAAALMSLAPAARMNESGAARRADVLILAGALDRACALAEQNAAFAAGPAGERLQIFCTLHAGEHDHAYFLYDLMREQRPEDRVFGSALAIADGAANVTLPNDTPPSPLLLAMLTEGKATPPDAWFRSAEPALLPRLLALPGASEARVWAAERAARLALIDTAALASAYAGLAVSAKDRAAAAAAAPDTPRRRAALHQAVQQASEPALRAKLIHQALRQPAADPMRAVNGRLYAPLLRGLAPASDLAGLAPDFARALFLAGDSEAARGWVKLARANAADPGVAAQLPGLALLSALAGENDPAWNRAARQFVERPVPTPQGARLAAIARLLPSATDAATPEAAPPAGGFFDPGLGLALRNAAAGNRIGETVLFALIALGDHGAGLSDPGALAEALLALRRIGLEGDVRVLAIEAAIANGA